MSRWFEIAIGAVAAAMLALCGFYAGHTSESVEQQHLITKVAQSEQELSSSRIEVQQQQRETNRVNAALAASGRSSAVDELMRQQDRVRHLEAEVTQYKELLARSQRGTDDRRDVLLLLSSPSVNLFALKGSEALPGSLGYVLVVPNSKLVFVASNLSGLRGGREYELWMVRKGDSRARSAGLFVPDETGHAYLQVDDGTAISEPATFFVTEEPAGGSEGPTGRRVLASAD